MKAEWRKVRVGDVGRIITGKTPRTAIIENYGGYIPFLTPSDNMDVKHLDVTAKKLTDIGLSEVKNCLLPPRSICVSCIGSDLGKVVMIQEETITNQQINSIIPNDGIDADFIYYSMLVLGKELNYISKTSTAVPIVNKSTFSNYTINLPPYKKQRAIAETLSCLDDKIELNNRINANLEAQAQAIFKSWFVDFEPWGGVMPDDWREGVLNDILCSIKNPIKAGKQVDLPYVPIDMIPMNSIALTDFRPNKEAKSSLLKFTKNNILIGAMRVYFHRVSVAPFDGITRSTCFILQPRENMYLEYALLLCNQNSTIDYAQNTSKGSTMPYAVWDNGLANMPISIPPVEVIQSFSNTLRSTIEYLRDSLFENRTLVAIRDTLLPKLMSGEVEVEENER
jgi:type I restriction enzyme S subunit